MSHYMLTKSNELVSDISGEDIINGVKPPMGFYRKAKNRIMIVRHLVEVCLNRHGDNRLTALKVSDFKKYNLYGFLTTYYNCSPRKALQEAYKEELSEADIFNDPFIILEQLTSNNISEPPRGFWTNIENRKLTVKFLIEEVLQKSSNSSDIYSISAKDFIDNGLAGFLTHYYQCSPNKAISEAFPDAHIFLFNRVDPSLWNNDEVRKSAIRYFIALVPPGTRKISMKTLLKLGLKHSLVKFYGGDIKKLLKDGLPTS